jgi:hypothetical protein
LWVWRWKESLKMKRNVEWVNHKQQHFW